MLQRFRGLAAAFAAALTVVFCVAPEAEAAGEATDRPSFEVLRGRMGLHVRRGATGAPPVVLLHGICGEPQSSCSAFAPLSPWSGGDLVCARADLACPAGGAMWSGGASALTRIEEAIAEASESGARFDPHGPRALVGFSQGAYVALRAARHAPGRYRNVLLIGAFVTPSRADLEAAGIDRLGLAAGDHDGAARTMRETAQRLAAEGYPARFVSLGKVGHTYVPDEPQKLAAALAWTTAPAKGDATPAQ